MPHSRATQFGDEISHAAQWEFSQQHDSQTKCNATQLMNLIQVAGYSNLPIIREFCNNLPSNPIVFYTQLFYALRDNTQSLSTQEIVAIDVLFEQARGWLEPVIFNNYRNYLARQNKEN